MRNYTKEKYFRSTEKLFSPDIQINFEDFHALDVHKDYLYPIHQHKNYELIITLNNDYQCKLNNKDIFLKPGNILVIKPNDWHSDILIEKHLHYVIHFSLISQITEKSIDLLSINTKPNQQIIKKVEDFEWIINQLKAECSLSKIYSSKIEDSLIELFFWKLVRNIPSSILSEQFKLTKQILNFENKVMAAFENNINRNMQVSELAKNLGMSKRSLENHFFKYFKTSPAKAFLDYRLKQSTTKLKSTSLSIKEISSLLGFNNQYQFSRAFKNKYKISPKIFRNIK